MALHDVLNLIHDCRPGSLYAQSHSHFQGVVRGRLWTADPGGRQHLPEVVPFHIQIVRVGTARVVHMNHRSVDYKSDVLIAKIAYIMMI